MRTITAILEELPRRFIAWAENLDARNKAGEFGKYPLAKRLRTLALAAEAQMIDLINLAGLALFGLCLGMAIREYKR